MGSASSTGPHSSSSAKAKAKNEFAAVLERKEPAQVVKSHQTARDPGSSSSFTTAASNKSSRTEFCCACPWTGAARSLHLGKLPCPKPFLLQSLIWVGGAHPLPAQGASLGLLGAGLMGLLLKNSKLLCLWSSRSVGLVSGSVCCSWSLKS